MWSETLPISQLSIGNVLVNSHAHACLWSAMGVITGPCQSFASDEANGKGNHMLVLWPCFIWPCIYTASTTWYPGPDVWQGHATDIFSCHLPALQLPILLGLGPWTPKFLPLISWKAISAPIALPCVDMPWGYQTHFTSCIRYVTAGRRGRKLATQIRAGSTGK